MRNLFLNALGKFTRPFGGKVLTFPVFVQNYKILAVNVLFVLSCWKVAPRHPILDCAITSFTSRLTRKGRRAFTRPLSLFGRFVRRLLRSRQYKCTIVEHNRSTVLKSEPTQSLTRHHQIRSGWCSRCHLLLEAAVLIVQQSSNLALVCRTVTDIVTSNGVRFPAAKTLQIDHVNTRVSGPGGSCATIAVTSVLIWLSKPNLRSDRLREVTNRVLANGRPESTASFAIGAKDAHLLHFVVVPSIA